jgi:outer membrane protein, heavy metal efflux system
MTFRRRWRGGAALVVLVLTGCASADPAATVAATGRTLAEKGIAGVDWRRDEAAAADALSRSRELLAAPLTVESAAAVALLRSPALQATLAELGVGQADLAQATRLANPGFAYSRLSGDGESIRTTGLFADVVDWLTQPLRRRLAEAELERVKLEVAAAVLDQVSDAKLALVEYQVAEALVERLSILERIDRAAADYAQALRAAGNLTELARANAEAGWATTKGELGEARAASARRREAVVRALGLSGIEAWSAAPPGDPPPALAGVGESMERRALEERLDLAAARWAVDALERARALHRRTRWLPVGIELGVERERETDGARLSGPTIELALPVFDTGRASLARHDAELARARAQLAALEVEVRSQVREKAGDLAAASELAAHYRETVLPLRLQVLDLTLREYNQMVAGTFEVLMAKQEQVDAERRYLEALAGAWVARIELDRALGTLAVTPVKEVGGGR